MQSRVIQRVGHWRFGASEQLRPEEFEEAAGFGFAAGDGQIAGGDGVVDPPLAEEEAEDHCRCGGQRRVGLVGRIAVVVLSDWSGDRQPAFIDRDPDGPTVQRQFVDPGQGGGGVGTERAP